MARPVAGTALAILLLAACRSTPSAPGQYWEPGVVLPSVVTDNPRGLLDLRGIIHAHSVYSHDACDGHPVVNGVRDPVCFDDMRRGLCQSHHDYMMLTDHPSDFETTPYPDALLYRAARGDRLVTRNGRDVANWLHCTDGHSVLVMAGTESGVIMPVGLEGQIDDLTTRHMAYNTYSKAAVDALHADGAVVLVAHTEGRTAAELENVPIDGFEMFNLHASAIKNADVALHMIMKVEEGGAGLPLPDLTLLPFMVEDERYISTWGTVLASGAERVTTMATDCHRNAFPMKLADGERIDSYRRTMIAFSNHLLVRPNLDGSWNDRNIKEALRAGRLYGAFEILGYPEGFDFIATTAGATYEMGDDVPLSADPVLHVAWPSIRDLDPNAPAPDISMHLLRAVPRGFEEVADSIGSDIDFHPTEPGAYRAEVDIVPHHLHGMLGDYEKSLMAAPLPWILSNPIYVR